MKQYDQVVFDLGTTQAEMMLSPAKSMRFYVTPATLAYLYDRDVEVVEMDIQLAYKLAIQQLTNKVV